MKMIGIACSILLTATALSACSGQQNLKHKRSLKNHDLSAKSFSVQDELKNYVLFDEKKALQQSSRSDKPILLYFTGHSVVTGRKMEKQLFSEKEITDLVEQKFIFYVLYCDDRSDLPKNMQIEVDFGSYTRRLKNFGDFHCYYQISEFNNLGQPFFVIMNSDKEILATADYHDRNPNDFIRFLRKGLHP